jgi:hypothetical protein
MQLADIQKAVDVIKSLSPEQKDAITEVFMKKLAEVDHLGEINQDTLKKIAGGILKSDIINQVLGIWYDPDRDPFGIKSVGSAKQI